MSTTDETAVTYLTQDAYDRLSRELQKLIDNRTAMAQEISDRREEGDLKENGGYHAAKEEQGKIEARIRQLTLLLRHAKVGAGATAADGRVAAGTVVTATIAGNENRFLLGSREIAGDSGLDVYSEQSPLGAAILGAAVDDTVTYTAPNGRAISVRIDRVEPYTG